MACTRTKDNILRNVDIYRRWTYALGMLTRERKPLQDRVDDFGMNYQEIGAFSRSGLWDHDPQEHLNVHSTHQVIAVTSGMILIENGAEKQPLYQNMAAFIPAGRPHRAVLMRENMPFVSHSLFIKQPLFQSADLDIHIFVMSDLLASLLRKMNERNLVDVTRGIQGHCLHLFLELLPAEMENRARFIRLPEVKSERNKRVVRFIRDNYFNRIRLEHLTRAVPLSIRQITRSFREEVRISPMEYLKLYRLLEASVLLHESNRTIIAVAQDCGFQSPSTFYEEFRHHFGISPNQFRKSFSE